MTLLARRPWVADLEKHALAISLILIAVASVRVALTYPVLSHTYDEPSHLGGGMEWLDQKTYTKGREHPPLARVMAALGPYLAGERSRGHRYAYPDGIAILGAHPHYDKVLALTRAGILPFLWIGALVVHAWSRHYFGGAVAVMAVFLFTQLPGILAHAGLATTDMAATALIGASVYAVLLWAEVPTARRTLVAGGCLGLAVLAKFSALLFVPSALLTIFGWYLATERFSARHLFSLARPRLSWLPLGVVAAAVVIWAGYRFSSGEIVGTTVRLPAPEFFGGIQALLEWDRRGHPSYLLGERSRSGWLYYFPVALSVKTPLPFLLLILGGAVFAARGKTPARWPLAYSLGILLCAMPSRINIGSRHVLPIYIGLAILAAAFAVDHLRRWRTNRLMAGTMVALLIWLTASVGLSHPDYLPYFNAMAGPEPEKVLVDSDLDWGQDVRRLAKRLQEVRAHEVALLPPLTPAIREAYLAELMAIADFPPIRDIDPITPSPGWNAVFLTPLRAKRLGLSDDQRQVAIWPELLRPTERVGKGVLLYYFEPTRGSGR